jgi:hypothetical protein
VTAGEGLAAAGAVRPAHTGAAAAVGGRGAGLASDAAERQKLAGGGAAFCIGNAELAAAVGVGGAGLASWTAASVRRGAGAGHAGTGATVAIGHAAAAGGRAGWCAADAVHASERATIARSRAGLLVGRAAGGGETDEINAARRIDAAQERAAVGVEPTGGPIAMTDGQRRAAPGGTEPRAAVGGAGAGAAVGGAGRDPPRARRGQLDVAPAAEGRPRDRQQRSDPGPLRCPQGCAPVPARRRAVATRRPLGNVAR